MNVYTYFAKDASRWEQTNEAVWGSHNVCPLFIQFKVMEITWSGISAISQAEAWGDPRKPRFGMAYLLLALTQEAEEERKFGLVVVWICPHQDLLPLLDEKAKKITLLINTREDQPYAFVQLCKDSWHVSLSNTWHLSVLVDGAPSRSACGCLSQLEVYQLLQWGGEVVYPEGLNGVWNCYGFLSPNCQSGRQKLPVSPLDCK